MNQTWSSVLPIHPAADLFPHMSDPELAALADDIKRNDQQVEIAIFVDENGVEKLLDGRNRLDAMERIGIPIIKDGELNRDAVRTIEISGNIDPYKYVLSVNVHRRHLTSEQKREVIEKYLKANPDKSNRQIAKEANDDHKKVGRVRKKLESTGALPQLEKTVGADGKERKQRTKKNPKAVEPSASADDETPVTAESTKVEEEKPTKVQEEDSLATRIKDAFGGVGMLLGDKSIWPPLNASREKRLQKALNQLQSAYRELIELASPAPRRGRPRKVDHPEAGV